MAETKPKKLNLNPKMQHLKAKLARGLRACAHAIKRRSTSAIIISACLVCFILAISTVPLFSQAHPISKPKVPSPMSNLYKINTLQSNLSNIETIVSTNKVMTESLKHSINLKLSTLEQQLSHLDQINDRAPKANSDYQQLSTLVHSKNAELSEKVFRLSQALAQLKAIVLPKPTLSAKHLPFNVVSITPWNGTPYVEIAQRHNTTMIAYLSLYQVADGWKVIDLDANTQTATFINQRNQVVHSQVKEF